MHSSEVGSVLRFESNTGLIPDFLVVLCTYTVLYHHRQNAAAEGKIRHCIYKYNKIKHFMQEDNLCNAFIIKVFPRNFSKQNRIWKFSSWFLPWSFMYFSCSSDDLKHVSNLSTLPFKGKNLIASTFYSTFSPDFSFHIRPSEEKIPQNNKLSNLCFTSQLLLLYKWSCLETAWQHVTIHHQNPASFSHVFTATSASLSVAICHILQKNQKSGFETLHVLNAELCRGDGILAFWPKNPL